MDRREFLKAGALFGMTICSEFRAVRVMHAKESYVRDYPQLALAS